MVMMITFNKQETKKMVRDYNAGNSLGVMATFFHVSIPIIRRTLVDAGVTIRKQGRPKVA